MGIISLNGIGFGHYMQGCTFHGTVVADTGCCFVGIVVGLLIMWGNIFVHWFCFIMIDFGRVVLLVVWRGNS
jgi:hypothetical protein